MSLADYFENIEGIGVLGTSDAEGKVDLAVYARPHVLDEQSVAFLMRDRRSHKNLQANPQAAYLFVERGEGYKGLRMHLTRTQEESDPRKIEAFRRRNRPNQDFTGEAVFLVHFHIQEVRQLIGDRPAVEPAL
ncbi:MAG: pyridoxamine 5'-phosphate oxidase family protein [Planctomycetes bacterium]|jgi:hypothetical protein|nr:pyridoxamine 5'-phosphate oxidase family protein [Planctomycetota bacterium]